MAHDRHWVEELFPPTFGLTVDEVLEDDSVFNQEILIGEVKKKREEPSMFERVAKKISPMDVSAIKNVYERVWLMEYLEKKANDGDIMLSSELQKNGNKCDVETSTSDIYEKIPLEDSCIWTSQEIEVLRAVFKTASHQNTELKAKLAATTTELETLKQKYKKHVKSNETINEQHQEAIKSNQRLKILCECLKSQNEEAERKIEQIKSDLLLEKEECIKQRKTVHKLEEELELEKLQHEQTQMKLALLNQEIAHKYNIQEEKLKALHEQDIIYLQKKIEELKVQLDKEKTGHERSKKGLDHLRNHFASLPYSGESGSTNAVVKDQLQKWSYSEQSKITKR